MTTPDEQYLQWVGAQTIAQQAAEQQQKQPVDGAVAQRLRNEQIMADRNRADLERVVEAAQQKQRQADKQREKEQAQQQQARAEQLEQSTKEVALQEWLATDGYKTDFERQWPEQYKRIQAQRAEGRDAQAKAKFAARYGF